MTITTENIDNYVKGLTSEKDRAYFADVVNRMLNRPAGENSKVVELKIVYED